MIINENDKPGWLKALDNAIERNEQDIKEEEKVKRDKDIENLIHTPISVVDNDEVL